MDTLPDMTTKDEERATTRRPMYVIDTAWRAAVRAELDRRGRRSQKDLAEAIKCDQGLLSRIVNGVIAASEYVPDISRELGVPMTLRLSVTEDREFNEYGALLKELDPERFARLKKKLGEIVHALQTLRESDII